MKNFYKIELLRCLRVFLLYSNTSHLPENSLAIFTTSGSCNMEASANLHFSSRGFLTMLLLVCLASPLLAQTITGPEQDCPHALPVCSPYIFTQPNSYSGWGNLREIPPNGANCGSASCTRENNSVWYIIKIIGNGQLGFSINPTVQSNDYDWVVYNITNTNCATLATTARSNFQVSCNFSGQGGNTGATGGSTLVCIGAGGGRFNARIPVQAGQTYMLVIDNFSSSQNGYTLDFDNWTLPSAAQVIGAADTLAPTFDSVTFAPPCGPVSQLNVFFSENIICSTLQPNRFQLTGPGGTYTITQVSSTRCNTFGNYAPSATLTISPALTQGGTYSLTLAPNQALTDLCGNVLDDTITFDLSGPQLVLGASPDTVCLGNTTQLSATVSGGTPPYAYSWQPSSGLSSTTAPNPTATIQTNTVFTVTITDATNCSATDSILVVVAPPLNVSASPPIDTICGDTLQITTTVTGGTPPFSAVWTPATGLSSTSVLNPRAAPAVTTQYIVTVTDSLGCVGNDTLTVVVGSSLPVDAFPDTTICVGESVQLGVSEGTSYLWTPATGLSSATSRTPIANPLTTTSYIVEVTDSLGCKGFDTLTITVAERPVAQVFNDTTICLGGRISLRAQGGTSYQWLPADSVECPTCPQTFATPGASGVYSVIVFNDDGCADTAEVQVTVLPAFTATVGQESPIQICSGDAAQVSVNAPGAVQYRWSPTIGINNPTSANPSISPAVSTTYTVETLNAQGCRATDTIRVEVVPRPQLADIPPMRLCHGDTRQIVLVGTRIDSVEWSPAQGLSCTDCGNPEITVTEDITYTIVAFGPEGCNDTTRFEVRLSGEVSVDIPDSVFFGTLSGCATSLDKEITIRNTSGEELLLQEFFFNTTAFSVISPPNINSINPLRIQPGAERRVRLRFAPFAEGKTEGSVLINVEPCGLNLELHLEGERSDALLGTSENALSFGRLPLCKEAKEVQLPIKVWNASPVTARLNLPAVPPPFRVLAPGTFPMTLEPGDTATITFAFLPTAAGTFEGEVLLPFQTPDCDDALRLPISGASYNVSLALEKEIFTFEPLLGCETSVLESMRITNTSEVPITITESSLPTGFRIANQLPISIPAGATTDLLVRFSPPDNGEFGGTASIIIEPCGDTYTFEVSGSKQGISLALAEEIVFDTLFVCNTEILTRRLNITNTSDSEVRLTVRSVETTEGITTTLRENMNLAGGVPFPFDVQIAPTELGDFEGEIRLLLSPCDIQRTITVRGFRALTQIDGPAIENFGEVRPGNEEERTLTWENTGNSPILVNSTMFEGDSYFTIEAVQPLLPARLLPGERLSIRVKLAAGDEQKIVSGRLIVNSNRPCAISSFARLQADISANTRAELQGSDLDFEGVYLGFSRTNNLVLSNVGDTTAFISRLSIEDDPDGVFSFEQQQGGEVAEGGTLVLPINFAPAASRTYQARLRVEYNSDSLFLPLIGFGARAAAELLVTPLGDKELQQGHSERIVLINNGEGYFAADAPTLAGDADFRLLNAQLVPRLLPTNEYPIEVEFTPQRITPRSATLRLTIRHNQYYPTHTQDIEVELRGRGIGNATIRMPDTTVSTGDGLVLPLTLSTTYSGIIFEGSAAFRATLRFNRTMVQTRGSSTPPCVLETEDCVVNIEGLWQPPSSVLFPIEAIAALGNADNTPLRIVEFEWLDDIPLNVTTINGRLTLDNIYREGGNRLVDTRGRIFLDEPMPNPASGSVTLRYGVVETGFTTIYLVDNLGKKVMTVFENTLSEGQYEVSFAPAGLAAGSYHVILQTPTVYFAKKLQIIP